MRASGAPNWGSLPRSPELPPWMTTRNSARILNACFMFRRSMRTSRAAVIGRHCRTDQCSLAFAQETYIIVTSALIALATKEPPTVGR